MKGADDVVAKFLKREFKEDEILEKSSDFAKIGLRTLVFAHRRLSAAEFENFMAEYNKENNSGAMPLIECDMDFLGRRVGNAKA